MRGDARVKRVWSRYFVDKNMVLEVMAVSAGHSLVEGWLRWSIRSVLVPARVSSCGQRYEVEVEG